MTKNKNLIVYEYGAMSSKYSCKAENKLTAYATMCLHYNNSAPLVVIYSPEKSKDDMWTAFDGKISARLDEIFGGKGSFDKYIGDNIDEVKKCYKTIKKLV